MSDKEMTDFADWILRSDYIKGGEKYWRRIGTDTFITSGQLYNRYMQSTKKTTTFKQNK